MEIDEKKIEEGQEASPEPETEEEDVDTEGEGATEPEEEADDSSDEEYKQVVDYWRKRAEKAEKTIVDKKKQDKEAPDTNNIDELVSSKVREMLGSVTRTMSSGAVDLVISQKTRSAVEAEAVRAVYDNGIVPTGDINADVENAIAIANKHLVQQRIAEMHKSAQSQSAKKRAATTSQRKKAEAKKEAPTDAERRMYQGLGFAYDEKKGKWVPKR